MKLGPRPAVLIALVMLASAVVAVRANTPAAAGEERYSATIRRTE